MKDLNSLQPCIEKQFSHSWSQPNSVCNSLWVFDEIIQNNLIWLILPVLQLLWECFLVVINVTACDNNGLWQKNRNAVFFCWTDVLPVHLAWSADSGLDTSSGCCILLLYKLSVWGTQWTGSIWSHLHTHKYTNYKDLREKSSDSPQSSNK